MSRGAETSGSRRSLHGQLPTPAQQLQPTLLLPIEYSRRKCFKMNDDDLLDGRPTLSALPSVVHLPESSTDSDSPCFFRYGRATAPLNTLSPYPSRRPVLLFLLPLGEALDNHLALKGLRTADFVWNRLRNIFLIQAPYVTLKFLQMQFYYTVAEHSGYRGTEFMVKRVKLRVL